MTDSLASLAAVDPEIADVIERELERQNTTIQLIASENFTSPAVLAAQGSVLTNKYSEGYPGKRYYGGNAVVDEAEEIARLRASDLFGAVTASELVCHPCGEVANVLSQRRLSQKRPTDEARVIHRERRVAVDAQDPLDAGLVADVARAALAAGAQDARGDAVQAVPQALPPEEEPVRRK